MPLDNAFLARTEGLETPSMTPEEIQGRILYRDA